MSNLWPNPRPMGRTCDYLNTGSFFNKELEPFKVFRTLSLDGIGAHFALDDEGRLYLASIPNGTVPRFNRPWSCRKEDWLPIPLTATIVLTQDFHHYLVAFREGQLVDIKKISDSTWQEFYEANRLKSKAA